MHFNVSNWLLEGDLLRDHGLNREAFPALIDPNFSAINDPSHNYQDSDKVILVIGEHGQRAYPYSLMTYHEVVNDKFEGKPIMVCYCVLADFPGVYYRETCGQEITYGVSGYTYINQSLTESGKTEAFILWDRETESLWNPLEGRGVSHTLKGVTMPQYPSQHWEVISWGSLQEAYPNAVVLERGQQMAPPVNWPALTCNDFSCCKN